jgi:hypothetical protein
VITAAIAVQLPLFEGFAMTDDIIGAELKVNKTKFKYVSAVELECVFGPASKSDALALAALAKDYNPVLLLPDVALAKGRVQPHLHPLWISTLADRCVRQLMPENAIVQLTLKYLSEIPQDEILRLNARSTQNNSLVTIAIFNRCGEKVVEAQAMCSKPEGNCAARP